MDGRIVRTSLFSLLFALSLLALLTPERYWTGEWVPYRRYEGEFSGKPVTLAPPPIRRAAAPFDFDIEMTRGICEVSRVDPSGRAVFLFSLEKGVGGGQALPAGERLQLDPGSGTGRYAVMMGLKWRLLSPYLWRCFAGVFLVGMLGGLMAVRFAPRLGPGWTTALKSQFTPRQWVALGALAVFAGIILCPALHESGHALVVIAFGGRVDDIVFTPLGGESPHVKVAQMPNGAGPWNAAGAALLPILIAYGLLIVWWALGRRLSRFAQALLLTPALLILFGSFASPFDDHLRGLAAILGFTGKGGILFFKFIPVCLTLATYGLVGWRIRRQGRR